MLVDSGVRRQIVCESIIEELLSLPPPLKLDGKSQEPRVTATQLFEGLRTIFNCVDLNEAAYLTVKYLFPVVVISNSNLAMCQEIQREVWPIFIVSLVTVRLR